MPLHVTMPITWDEPKRLSNLAKHGLDFGDITAEFFENSVATAVINGRVKFVGAMEGALVVVVIAAPLGDEAISIISLRRANRKERKIVTAQVGAPGSGDLEFRHQTIGPAVASSSTCPVYVYFTLAQSVIL